MGHVHPLHLTKVKTEEDIGDQNNHQETGEQNRHQEAGIVHPMPLTNQTKLRKKHRVNVLWIFLSSFPYHSCAPSAPS